MVSYQQLDQHGIKQVLVSSSGRPKAQSLQQEDQFFNYEYDSRGGLKKKTAKSNLAQYEYWLRHNVKYDRGVRTTPLTEFEKQIGVGRITETFRYSYCLIDLGNAGSSGCSTRIYTKDEWKIFKQTHEIDYGSLEIIKTVETPTDVGQGHKDWRSYFTKLADQQNLEIVSLQGLEFREKQKPTLVEKIPSPARPNPKEVEKVEPVEVEPIEIEPIKEVVKYSPLMIAGILVIVVILLLKRRRA